MKVKNLNASSKRTKESIRQSFAELLYEKHELQHITVTELVKRAGITRASFYTHYENIYDVAKEFQDNTMEILLNDETKISSIEDIFTYIDNLTKIIKENENTYRMLLVSNEEIFFFEKLEKTFVKKAVETLKDIINDDYLELKMNFFIDGVTLQILKYFRGKSNYTIDELNKNTKEWIIKLFK